MLTSRSFPQLGRFPGSITFSSTSTRPPGAIASRQRPRMRTQRSSSQSWMMYFIM